MLDKRFQFFVSFDYLDKDLERGIIFAVYDTVTRDYCQVARPYNPKEYEHKRWTMPSFSPEHAKDFAQGKDEKTTVFHYVISSSIKCDELGEYEHFVDTVNNFIDYFEKTSTVGRYNEMIKVVREWYERFVLSFYQEHYFRFISETTIDGKDFIVVQEEGKIKLKNVESFEK